MKSYLDQKRKELNNPLNKIRKKANSNLKEKIIDSDSERQEFFEFIEKQKNKRTGFKKEEPSKSGRTITETDLDIIKRELMKHFYEETEKIKKELKEDLITTSTQIFEKGEFMKSFKEHIIKMIESEVRSKIGNSDLHSVVNRIVSDHVKTSLKPIIETVVSKFVKEMIKKLDYEYRVTKELTYSINAEIRHTLMKAPISHVSEEMIKTKIMNVLEKKSLNRRLLENKKK